MPSKKKRVGKYELGRTLGEGTFGKVKYAEHVETSEKVAIKVLDKAAIQRQNMGAQIKREVSVMKSMAANPRVVQLREVLASKAKIYLVLELVTGGELFDEIVRDGKFEEDKAKFYFRQLVEGLTYCHGRGVSHRDLKPENLLLDERRDLKISDFGLSALYAGCGEDGAATMSRSELLHTTCGTPNYVAPEVLENEGYDGFKADVWSAGVVLYVLVTGCLPFDEPTLGDLFRKIKTAEFEIPAFVSDPVRDLLRRILVSNPRERMTLREIRRHEWLRQGDGPGGRSGEDGCDGNGDGDGDGKGEDGCDGDGDGEGEETLDRLRSSESWSSASSGGGGGGGAPRVGHSFRFLASQSAADVLEQVQDHLQQMCFEVVSGKEPGRKAKAFRTTPRGMISLAIEVQPDRGGGCAVEIHKGKGSLMEYHIHLNQLKRRLRQLIIEDGQSG